MLDFWAVIPPCVTFVLSHGKVVFGCLSLGRSWDGKGFFDEEVAWQATILTQPIIIIVNGKSTPEHPSYQPGLEI